MDGKGCNSCGNSSSMSRGAGTGLPGTHQPCYALVSWAGPEPLLPFQRAGPACRVCVCVCGGEVRLTC